MYITMFNSEDLSSEENHVSTAGRMLGVFLTFTSAWLCAGLLASNRLLKGPDQWIIIFFHGFIGLFMSICYFTCEMYLFDDALFFTKYTSMQYFLTVMACVSDATAIYAGLKAAQSSNLGFVGLISYTQIMYAFILDIFFFHEKLDLVNMVAVCLILVSLISVSVYKIRAEPEEKESENTLKEV